ncbi:MAG TPA: NADH-quinone oxidoreductase subunit L [Actinocrinis sp.]|nr:NADH-quinone oxidoreductase subunit L [Actinocrinis sp.]
MNTFATIAIALPALGALSTFLGGRDRAHARFWSTAPTVLAFFACLAVSVEHGTGGASVAATRLAPAGTLTIWLGTRVTGMSAVVAILVTFVASCVQVYSLTYMKDDRRYATYAGLIALFTSAMLLVVFSVDLVVLLVGWEIMGACSYFLIGHYWEKPDARAGSLKAFLVTKTGDVPFLFGIIALGVQAHSFRIGDVLLAANSGELHHTTLIALLLLCGALGKSAQFPLHTWLPDAMAGPTPISALIHAATMVAAGVYMIALLYPVFLLAPGVLLTLAVLAAITMLGAAVAALAQTDIKKVLAYSTVSQLAYMMGALAVGGRTAALFHLVSHGAFKALLFLAAGVVIHRVGSNDLADYGGLRHRLPVAFGTMTVGLGALVGLPPLSGFFSKESVLGTAWAAQGEFAAGGKIIVVVGLLTVAVTGAYATRLWLRTFYGPLPEDPPTPNSAAWLVEAPQTELVVLTLLAIPAALFGLIALGKGTFDTWIGGYEGQAVGPSAALDLGPALATSLISLAAAGLGGGLVWLAWRRDPKADPAAALLGPLRRPALAGFHADQAQDFLTARPAKALARLVAFLDTEVVDAYVRGAGAGTRGLGGLVRRSQAGNVQIYLTVLLTGVIVIACVFTGQVG